MFSRKKSSLLLSSLLLTTIIAAGCAEDEAETPKENPAPTEQVTDVLEETQIVINGDVINSHLVTDAICVVNSRFEVGQRLVFRASVDNAETKEIIEDAKVKVVLATGEEFEMVLGPHGEEATQLYTVGWTIPDDFPTGTLDYQYIAEVDGKKYVYEPFNVSLSKLTIIEKTADSGDNELSEDAKG